MKNSYKAKSAGYELIAGGTIVPPGNEPVEVTFEPPGQEQIELTVIFSTQKDETNKASRWEAKTEKNEEKRINIILYNLNAELGGGPNELVPLWKHANSQLILQLKVYTSDNRPTIYHFSIYLKKEEVKIMKKTIEPPNQGYAATATKGDTYNDNTSQNYITTTEDKLRIHLGDFSRAVKESGDWAGAVGVAI